MSDNQSVPYIEVKFERKKFIEIQEFLSGQLQEEEIVRLVRGNAQYRLATYFYSHSLASKNVPFTFERPTFLDWLFRRQRQVVIHIEAEELLAHPPTSVPNQETLRIYTVFPTPGVV